MKSPLLEYILFLVKFINNNSNLIKFQSEYRIKKKSSLHTKGTKYQVESSPRKLYSRKGYWIRRYNKRWVLSPLDYNMYKNGCMWNATLPFSLSARRLSLSLSRMYLTNSLSLTINTFHSFSHTLLIIIIHFFLSLCLGFQILL